jgi:hypothetical protein
MALGLAGRDLTEMREGIVVTASSFLVPTAHGPLAKK